MADWNITLMNEDNQTALIDCDDFINGIVQMALPWPAIWALCPRQDGESTPNLS